MLPAKATVFFFLGKIRSLCSRRLPVDDLDTRNREPHTMTRHASYRSWSNPPTWGVKPPSALCASHKANAGIRNPGPEDGCGIQVANICHVFLNPCFSAPIRVKKKTPLRRCGRVIHFMETHPAVTAPNCFRRTPPPKYASFLPLPFQQDQHSIMAGGSSRG